MPPYSSITDRKVAVVIAAYNAEATIGAAITSALAQVPAGEVIVVDDASSDDTADVAIRHDDGSGRLKVLRQKRNQGPAAARNRAMRESVSEWISVLDADDYMLPGRLATLLEHAGQAELIADDLWQIRTGDPLKPEKTLLNLSVVKPQRLDLESFVLGNLTGKRQNRGELGFLKPLMNRKFLLARQIHYDPDMRLGEDYDLYARALVQGARFLLVPPAGYVSVIRSDSLSGRHGIEDLKHLRDCNETLLATPTLSAAEAAALRRLYRSTDCRLQWRLMIEAVKVRDIAGIAKVLSRSLPVSLYVMHKLLEQAGLRLVKTVGLARPRLSA